MTSLRERLAGIRDRVWAWFVYHAEHRHALAWFALVAFLDGIFLPIAPEFFLVALMLAHPKKWREYLMVGISACALGAAVGYYIGFFLFHSFGLPILHLYHLEGAFHQARHLLQGHVFITMLCLMFLPLPDKVFIYAAGFLGVHFAPFITGYFLGRGIRMAIVAYLTGRYGRRALEILNRYLVWVALAVVVYLAAHFYLVK